MRHPRGFALVCSALWLSSSLLAQAPPARNRIDVDPRQLFQTIDGFGVNFTGPYFRESQKPMFEALTSDLGATIFRVLPYLVYSNWEEVNDNDDPGVMNWEYYDNRYRGPIFEAGWAALRYLNSRGIRPVIALMGPAPDWMVDDKAPPPGHKVCADRNEKLRPSHLNPAMYEEFAEELVSMLLYARTKAHIDFGYFSPFNETDCYPREGPRIDPEEAPKVLSVIARRLKKEGLGDVKLMVADQAIVTNNYIGPILEDAELMKQVGAFSFHTYGEDSVGPQVERVRASRFPQAPVWVTEYGDLNDRDQTAENEWKHFALAANRRALRALNQGASALVYFNAFDDYEECMLRLTYYGLFRAADPAYSLRKRYYATRQLYHFVRPGARRVSATTEAPGLTVSAFRNKNSLVVVGVKEGGPNRLEVALPASEAPTAWELYATTRELNCAKVDTLAVRDGVAQVDLPDEAVFTLVGVSAHGPSDATQKGSVGRGRGAASR